MNCVCGIENNEVHHFKLFLAGGSYEYSGMINSLRNTLDKRLKSYKFEVIKGSRNNNFTFFAVDLYQICSI